MGDVKSRIDKLGNKFSEMQVTSVEGNSVIYVVVMFPYNWIIADEIEEKFDVKIGVGDRKGQYYFCTDISNGFDCVFDAIDYNIEKMEAAQERAELLTQKVKELKEIFENEEISLESLRTLKITYDEVKPIILTQQDSKQETDDKKENIDSEEETKRGRKKK